MRSDKIKKGIERSPHRALLKATGVTDADMQKPFIAIVNSYVDIIPGPHFDARKGKIISLDLVANNNYYGKIPYIKKITFKFYQSESDAISAFNRKEVEGINYLSPENMGKIASIGNKNVYKLNIPRYYAVFFNQTQNKFLADKTVRLALAYAVDRQAIIDGAMNDLIRPALYQAHQHIEAVAQREGLADVYDVVGPVCETGDFLGKDRELAIEAGDLLIVRSSGAYGFAMSSNYNSRGRPPEVMVDGDKTYLVRSRETFADLVRGESLLP